MEKELFDWSAYDELDTLVMGFYDCTLKQELGGFPPGHKFSMIELNFRDGALSLFENEDDSPINLQLELKVKE